MKTRILSFATAVVVAGLIGQANAQWLATPVDNVYGNAANWTGGIINNDFSLDSSITAITLTGTQAVNSGTAGAAVAGSPFRIGPAATPTISSSYTFSGGLFSAGSGASFTVTANAVAPTQTINTSIYQGARTTSASKSFNASGPIATSKFIINGNYNYQTVPASGVTTAGLSDGITLNGTGYGVFNGIIADGNAATNGATVAGNVYVIRNGVAGTVWELNGANTFSGGVELANNNGSTTILGNKSALGTGALRVNAGLTGYTILANTDLSGANAIANTINYVGGTGAATTTSAVVTFTVGTNTATFTGTAPAVGDLVTTNSGNFLPIYTRVTAVSGNTVTFSNNAAASGTSGTITTLPFNTTNTQTLTIAGTQNLTFSGTQNLTTVYSNGGVGNLALIVSNTGLTTFSGVLQQQGGVGGLSKSGAGTLQITGANTYAGATTITQGVLLVNNTTGSATGSGALAMNNGTTLAGIGTVGGAATIGSAASIAPGATTATIGTLNVGSATLAGTLRIQYDVATGIDKLADAGVLDISAATSALVFTNLGAGPLTAASYVIATYGTLTGTAFGSVTGLPTGYTLNYGTGTNSAISLISAVATPEPTTLGAIAAASTMLLRRRRSAK